jgi:hypothetical protein
MDSSLVPSRKNTHIETTQASLGHATEQANKPTTRQCIAYVWECVTDGPQTYVHSIL